MNQSMSRILAFVAAAAVLSCDLNDSSESSAHSPRTVQYAPRLLTAAGTPVPAVDSIYVRLTTADSASKGPLVDRSFPWSARVARLGSLVVGQRYTLRVEGRKLGVDGRSLSTWWSTTTTGEVPDTTTTVWAENLGVEVGDTTLPVAMLPVSERLPAGTPQATLSFEIPESTDSIFVDDRYQAPPAGGKTFTKAIDVAEGESRRVIVRLVDRNRNVWLHTVTFSRAMAPSEDKTGPTVELVAPGGDRTLSAGTRDILVRVRVTDPAGVSAVRLGNQDAVLSGASEWSATVALQSDTNAIAVVATDAKGNQTSRVLLQVVVPPQSKDVRLVDLGLPAGYATVPAPGDTVWRVVVPNIAASVALHPLAGDRKATILHNGERVIDSIVVSLDPTGGVQELRLRVVSAEADSAQEYLVRIEHLQPDPIEFIPVGGATQLFSWADSLPSIAWRVTGNRPIDIVLIDGRPADCDAGICSAVVPIATGKSAIRIEARYADIETRAWDGSVEAVRAGKPAPGEAKLFKLDLDLIGGEARIDTSRLAAESLLVVEIDNAASAITLRPRATSDLATVRVLPGEGPTLNHLLSPAGGLLRDTIEITSDGGAARSRIHVVLRHLAPDSIVLTPRGGDRQEIGWGDSVTTVSWVVTGSRPRGPVLIAGQAAHCVSDTCSRTITFAVGSLPVGIEASYLGMPDVWRDTIVVTRRSKPLSNDAGLLGFGSALPGRLQGSDTLWTLSVPSETRSLTLVPRPSGIGARATIDGTASQKEVGLSPDGDSLRFTVTVTPADGSREVRYHLAVLHAPVAEPTLEPTRGDSQVVGFETRSAQVAWKIASGPWPLGPVYINGVSVDSNLEGSYLRMLDLPSAGAYHAVIRASYAGGSREWLDTVAVRRLPDTTSPRVVQDGVLMRLLDVPFDSSRVTVGWRVSDNHRLDRVEIGNFALGYQPISPVGGDLYSRRVDLAALPNSNAFVIIARDSSGNTRRDTVRITRRQDTAKPSFVRGLGAAMRSVPFDTTATTVSWNVADNHRLAKVEINGNTVLPNGSDYTYRLQLGPDRTSAVLVAVDSSGNESRDSVEIVRSSDIDRPILGAGVTTHSQDVPFETDRILVAWTVTDNDAVRSVSIGTAGDLQPVSAVGGAFSRTVPLVVGENRIHIVAIDRSNNTSRDSVAIVRKADIQPPTTRLVAGPASDILVFDSTNVTVSWRIEDTHKLGEVTIGGVEIAGIGGIYTRRMPLAVGRNAIALLAKDSSGNAAVDTVKVERLRDEQAPSVSIGALPRAVGSMTTSIVVSCQAADNHKIQRVTVSQGTTTVSTDLMAGTLAAGTYRSRPLPLAFGTNVITVVAYDSSNNPSSTQTTTVIRDNQAPTVESKTTLSAPITWVRGGMITVEWTLRDNHMLSMVYDDRSQVIAPSSPGVYRVEVLYKAGRNAVAIRAADSAGNELYDTIFFETKLVDAENNLYRIREMPDTNVWMVQNLRSTPPTQPTASVQCHGGDCEANGRYYTWAGAMNIDPQYNRAVAGLPPAPTRGVCPEDWHVPTYEEWQTLLFAVAKEHGLEEFMDNGAHLLKTATNDWFTMGLVGTVQQYTYYPGLDRYEGFLGVNWSDGAYAGAIAGARFWLPLEHTATTAEALEIVNGTGLAVPLKNTGKIGVRCVAD